MQFLSDEPSLIALTPSPNQTNHTPTGRLSFLLATDLADATAGVGAALAVVKDDTRRERQNEWFLEVRCVD